MALNPTTAFAVTDSSQVAEPRRVVLSLASRLEFSEERAGCAAVVLTELATNLVKHARQGEILMHPVCSGGGTAIGIEIVAVDKGPGIPDFALSRRNGYSTTGTLGHGLGAVERLADSLHLDTQPTGTVLAARVLREKAARPEAARPEDDASLDVGAVQVSKAGEPVCGDGWGWRLRPGRLTMFVADGLGHGLGAHEAARVTSDVFARHHERSPKELVEDAHAALRPTRGAAVAFIAIDLEFGIATYAGLGNIAGAILLTSGKRHNLVSHNGTAGHNAGRIQEFSYPLPSGAVLVMASDGLQTHWHLERYSGLQAKPATVIAATLYRDFSRRRDDVTVAVAKQRPPLTGHS